MPPRYSVPPAYTTLPLPDNTPLSTRLPNKNQLPSISLCRRDRFVVRWALRLPLLIFSSLMFLFLANFFGHFVLHHLIGKKHPVISANWGIMLFAPIMAGCFFWTISSIIGVLVGLTVIAENNKADFMKSWLNFDVWQRAGMMVSRDQGGTGLCYQLFSKRFPNVSTVIVLHSICIHISAVMRSGVRFSKVVVGESCVLETYWPGN